MINLIPTAARQHVKTEYWVRVVSVWLMLLSFAFLIVGSLLIPSLILIRSQLMVHDSAYGVVSAQNDKYDALEKKVTAANAISIKLTHADISKPFTQLVSDIESLTRGVITIDSISTSRSDGEVKSIQVSGKALSRAALVHFRDDLESHDSFTSVELPLSNLAKDKDVPFSIVIMVSSILNQ